MRFHLSGLVFLLFLSACNEQEAPVLPEPQPEKILHISHTRTEEQGTISPKVSSIDYSKYNAILLGGDLDVFTSESEENMRQWDDIFDFGSESTLWTLGNHDTSDRSLVEAFTGRPSFYAHTQNDITFLVLDTQENSSNITGGQLDLVQNVTDTISESDYLIVLTHKLLYLQGNPDLEVFLTEVPNGGPGDCGWCTNPNNFWEDIYPLLNEVQNRDINVVCIAGDLGKTENEFDYLTPEGIRLMASGMSVDKEENKVLVISRESDEKIRDFEFVNIEDL